jgi:hypothetical protein
MAEKEGLSLFEPLPRQRRRAESADYPVTVSALATVLARRSGRSSALPYPPSSAAILPPRLVFATGRFFIVNF